VNYVLKPSCFFLKQLEDLSPSALDIVKKKLLLLKINPFRFKRINGYTLFLFRIRFADERKAKRLVYVVDKQYVKILCVLDRDKGYKDLEKYLKKHGY
jgi:mRNA-degrading endonuclease RelE of RelBE toxin-antitoxin system